LSGRPADARRGLLYGAAAYGLWGLFPLYWPLLEPAGAVEILAHRIVWSVVFLAAVLAATHGFRVHTALSDEDALLLALAAAIHASPVEREELEAKRAELESEGRLSPIARDMLEKALATDNELASETVEEEVDADELAAEATQRLVDLNQDLALLADVFADLDETRKQELLTQLRYSSDLVAWLESL